MNIRGIRRFFGSVSLSPAGGKGTFAGGIVLQMARIPRSALITVFFCILLSAAALLFAFGESGLFVSGGRGEELRFDEMYSGASSLGIQLSDKLRRLTGRRVRMTGFMAPPLKPTLSFFVLTAVPLSICPFCSSDADWPADIVVVKLEKPVVALPFDRPIEVEGVLEVGTETDAETGFVSLVRVAAEDLREATGKAPGKE